MTNPPRSPRRLRIAPGDSRAASPAGRGEAKTADHDYKIENVCSPGNPTRFRSEDRTILVQFSHLSPTHCPSVHETPRNPVHETLSHGSHHRSVPQLPDQNCDRENLGDRYHVPLSSCPPN